MVLVGWVDRSANRSGNLHVCLWLLAAPEVSVALDSLPTMAITPSRQRNAVSEGMALGLIMCNRFTLPYDKLGIDLSFGGAWRSCQYRHRFSQVDTDIRQDGMASGR